MAVYIALVHYPVYNKNKQIVATAVTNLDIHDIARIATTFKVAGYFIVHNENGQKKIVEEILDFWRNGVGKSYNKDRAKAFEIVSLVNSLEDCKSEIEKASAKKLNVVVTSAKNSKKVIAYSDLRAKIDVDEEDYLLVFGTGWGLSQEIMESADFILPPILGKGEYNHLSVRAAVAIVCDRLMGY